jgi:hypothetical protein
MAGDVDPRVVGFGACVEVAIAVPTALLVTTLRQDDIGTESNLWLVAALLALVVAPAVAGVLVGRRRPDSPALHAALACAAGWVLVAMARLLRATIAGDELASLIGSLLSIAPIQIGIGVLGALFARPRARPEGDRPPTEPALDGPPTRPDTRPEDR